MATDDEGNDTNNIVGVITALVTPVQDIESVLQALLLRNVEDATDDALTVLGKLVGELRFTTDDELYRRGIRARIAANRSSGLVEDMLKVIGLVLADETFTITYRNDGNATATVKLDDDIMPSADILDLLMGFVRDAQAGGVRTIIETPPPTIDPATCFKWDTAGRGWDSGAPWRIARD